MSTMAVLPLIFLAFVASSRAGEIIDTEGPAPIATINTDRGAAPAGAAIRPAGNSDRTVPAGAFIGSTANKTGGDRAGWELPNPTYMGDSSYGGAEGAFQCQSLRYRNKCYFLALSQESWHTGRDYCTRIGHTLARIESADEATFLASYLYEGGHNNYWVDVNDERTEGVWTYADNSPAFTDWWAPNEPNGNRLENCGLLVIGKDRIGRLIDEPCGEWRRYICERRTETVCRRAGYRRKCYWFSVQPATWFNAREYCATMGQRLARVTATDESNFLARVMPRASWIDLRYGGQGVGWTYADGTSGSGIAGLFGGASFMGSWGGGQRCAELRRYNAKEGRTVGAECNSLKQFVCESESLPAGSEIDNPEDIPGSVFGSQIGGPAMGPAGPVNPMDPQMAGGVQGLGPGLGSPGIMEPGYGMGMGMGGMGGMGMPVGGMGMMG